MYSVGSTSTIRSTSLEPKRTKVYGGPNRGAFVVRRHYSNKKEAKKAKKAGVPPPERVDDYDTSMDRLERKRLKKDPLYEYAIMTRGK